MHSLHVTPPLPSPALLDAAGSGDADARQQLFRDWAPVVLRWCKSLGGPKVDAEDAAHDVLVTALTRLPTLREAARFDAWMFGITRRVLTGHRRTAWVRGWIPGFTPDVPDSAEGPNARIERNQTGARVQAILERLPEDHREILVLCDLEERSDEAAAALLGVAVGTAKSRLRRARERFQILAERSGLAADNAPAALGGGR
jgi:RNA polymerase sigma-70 factor (ECF subfamily)